jgi:hypothetical protein
VYGCAIRGSASRHLCFQGGHVRLLALAGTLRGLPVLPQPPLHLWQMATQRQQLDDVTSRQVLEQGDEEGKQQQCRCTHHAKALACDYQYPLASRCLRLRRDPEKSWKRDNLPYDSLLPVTFSSSAA